jgi:hypothetical protein
MPPAESQNELVIYRLKKAGTTQRKKETYRTPDEDINDAETYAMEKQASTKRTTRSRLTRL